MTTGTATPHVHSFPCNPPGGSLLAPGPCECGTTYAQDEADKAFAAATLAGVRAYPLPDVPYLTGVQGDWHAVRRADAAQTSLWWGRTVTTAVCGRLCRLAVKHGAYDPDSNPVAYGRCPECAWIVASETGALDREVQRLIPGSEDAAVLAGLMPDPRIAFTAAATIAEAARLDPAEHRGYDRDGDLHPSMIQIFAAITRHVPVILRREDCADGDCGHDQSRPCPASAACAECSLQAGGWAGEWEGVFRGECTIPAPCQVLTRLAEAASEVLAEARRAAEVQAEFDRKETETAR